MVLERYNNLELIEIYEFTDPILRCKRNTAHAITYYGMYGMLGRGACVYSAVEDGDCLGQRRQLMKDLTTLMLGMTNRSCGELVLAWLL